MAENTRKTDWVTPIAIIGGGAALAVGAYFLIKKKTLIEPGDTYEVTFSFKYRGPQSNYLLRVTMGNIIGWIFNEEESTREEYPIELSASTDWQPYTFTVSYHVPDVIGNLNDMEYSIRYANTNIVSGARILADNVVNPN